MAFVKERGRSGLVRREGRLRGLGLLGVLGVRLRVRRSRRVPLMGVLGRRRVGVVEPDQKPIDASDELPLGVCETLGLPFLGFLIGGTTEKLSLCVLKQGEILRIRKPVSRVVSLSSTVSGHSPFL